MRRAMLVALGVALPLAALAAQESDRAQLVVQTVADPAGGGRVLPEVRVLGLLADGRWISTLRSGFPLRLHFRLELWRERGGWFDAFERQVEWDVVVRREPLLDQYTVSTLLFGRNRERRYASLEALTGALGVRYRINLFPAEPGEYYYTVSLRVSTLSDSDLEALERFLRGDLGPAAGGEERVGDALGRGAKRLLLRVAGLPTLRLETRSPRFQVGQ